MFNIKNIFKFKKPTFNSRLSDLESKLKITSILVDDKYDRFNNHLLFYKSRNVASPNRGTTDSAGFDFFVPNDYINESNGIWSDEHKEYVIELLANSSVNIPSGIHVKLPSRNWVLIGFNKSGIAIKKSLNIGACVIDYDYQGEIHINLHNIGPVKQIIRNGDKLTQFVLLNTNLCDIQEISSLEELYSNMTSERGTGMAGSTGTNSNDGKK